MRIVLLMKSRFSYERLKNELKKHDVYKYTETIDDIRDCIQYWGPDVAVLDVHSPFYEEAKELFFRFNVDVVEFVSDFESVIEEIETYAIFHTSESDNQQDKQEQEDYIYDFSEYEKKINEEVKPKEKEVVIEVKKEIVEVEKEVERISYVNIPSKLIVVGSMWQGAGSTFFSTNLARAIAKRNVQVSYVEYPTIDPYMFHYFNISSWEEESEQKFVDYARIIHGRGIAPRGKAWVHQGVQWILNDPRYTSIKEWTYEKMLGLVYSLNTPVTIVDISTKWNEEGVQHFLHQADHIFVCIEPDPIKINRIAPNRSRKSEEQREEYKTIQFLKQVEKNEKVPYEYIVMKSSKPIEREEWLSCLGKVPIVEIEYIPYPDIMSNVWDSRLTYDDELYHEELEKVFFPIIQTILPAKFHHLEKNDDTIIGRFKKILRREKL